MGSSWKSALAIGAALAPTSLGFSAYLLKEHGELDTPLGNLICTAGNFQQRCARVENLVPTRPDQPESG